MSSSIFIVAVIFLLIGALFFQLGTGAVWFVDFGRIFFLFDVIDINLVLLSDTLGLTAAILVLTLTLSAQYFGVEYMYREAFVLRLVYLLNFFATSVVLLFFVYDFFLILVVWELIGLFSLLLVNFYSTRIYTVKAAFKTFLFSRFSDFFIFIVFFFFVLILNSTDLSVLFLKIPFFVFFNVYISGIGFNMLNLLGFFIVIAGGVKAAQFFFHVWLPDAMEAPTPASALIHSSTLVIMGIYLIIRFNVLFEFSYLGNTTLSVLGGLTIAVGAISASFQNDIKKLVAYSTVSQMGYLFCGCGFMAYKEVIFYLAVHAMNKAFLFIMVGYVVHFFTGNTDLRFMGRLYTYSFDLTALLIIISLNLTGLPTTSGFIAKEFLVFQTFKSDYFSLFVRVTWFVSFLLTPVYMLFLNYFVAFRTNQTYVSNATIPNPGLVLFTRGKSTSGTQSLVIAKMTSAFLGLLLLLVLFLGEYALTVLLSSNLQLEAVTSFSFLNEAPLVSDNLLLATYSLSTALSLIILTSSITALRFLYLLVN